jgi:hypothetical protein
MVEARRLKKDCPEGSARERLVKNELSSLYLEIFYRTAKKSKVDDHELRRVDGGPFVRFCCRFAE